MSMYGMMRNSEGYYSPTEGIALQRAAASQVKRGEIYWVKIPFFTGSEMNKTRPAIIVSNDERNASRHTVTVVFCSESPQRVDPEHVGIVSTGSRSTVLCDHIYTVDKSRIGDFIGVASKQEMDAIGVAIRHAVGLMVPNEKMGVQAGVCREAAKNPEPAAKKTPKPDMVAEAQRLKVERDTYKAMYESLLDRMTMERRVGA